MRLALLPVLAFAATAVGQTAAPPAPAFLPKAFRAHVTFLADDALEGRKTATRGHEIAARYVAAQKSFRIRRGKITHIVAQMVMLPYRQPTGWAER
jgi:hypothetical protein